MSFSYRCKSNETVTLSIDKVNRIPYLAALTRSTQHFKNVHDEHEYIQLDPWIEYHQFALIINEIGYESAESILLDLNESEDIVSMIILMDYLCLLERCLPSLEQIDTCFFRRSDSSFLENMNANESIVPSLTTTAIQFAIGIVTEYYDHNCADVSRKIYLNLMYILGASKIFPSKLRSHLYRIADNYSDIFAPGVRENFSLGYHAKPEYSVSPHLHYNVKELEKSIPGYIGGFSKPGSEFSIFSAIFRSFLNLSATTSRYPCQDQPHLFNLLQEDVFVPIIKYFVSFVYEKVRETEVMQNALLIAMQLGWKFVDIKSIIVSHLLQHETQTLIAYSINLLLNSLALHQDELVRDVLALQAEGERSMNKYHWFFATETKSSSVCERETYVCEKILRDLCEPNLVIARLNDSILEDVNDQIRSDMAGFIPGEPETRKTKKVKNPLLAQAKKHPPKNVCKNDWRPVYKQSRKHR